MKTLEKKLFELSKQYVDSSYLGGSVSTVVENLLRLESEFRDKVETEWDASITLDVELIINLETEYYGYDGGKDFYLKAYRYETDKEFKIRISATQAKEDIVRQRELATLAKLKAKYGDVS